ncbi:D-alanyl-D-alanine carboxypeptidase [Actinomadura kijaniata]|uniref:D-alanyl-D-alanine carboxypeptidase (Penicillin-binding protein 5/6) n=1 Tax=Actinomadura namibiensis TaxID=182080 RepID=A0A7W3LUJ2_ACTNM|nr:D-alanyl-D-alanine carboxypeptidase [Actinomadura namibiensis]MBA8954546.1 D-alanyl-D-alanine carboxypeptidase (penicillin-binding protein 5/6) [Actinomadura namibiensis]
MRSLHRASAALSIPLVSACLVAAPSAVAAGATTATGAVSAVPPREPVGGPQLGGRGVIVNAGPGVPAAPKIKAASWLIADGDTGEVLAARDPHGHYLPASTLKTLTTIALIPKLDPNRMVRPSQAACDVEGTKVGMTPKLTYKVSDLFYALMMMSANDAAVTLAEANGGMRKTLADMNAEARRLNAHDTVAGSPNGLDVDLGLNVRTQHTSAYDLALILREGLKNPQFRGYVQKIDHWFPAPPSKKQKKKGKKTGGYPIHTHNRMLEGQAHAYRGMLGGKNGFTMAARQTYVAAARRGDRTIIISLMKADQQPSPYAAKLLDWGFAAAGKAKPIGALVPPGELKPATKPAQDGNPLLPRAIASDQERRDWVTIGAVVGGVGILAGVLALVMRRRREGDDAEPSGGE